MKKNTILRISKTFSVPNIDEFKQKILLWSGHFREIIFLDSNAFYNQNQKYKSFDAILAIDAFTSLKTDFQNAFEDLKQYQQTTKDWIFGYLGYDLKNNLERLHSDNLDGLDFADLFFFQPKKLFFIKDNEVELQYLNLCEDEIETDFDEILNYKIFKTKNNFEHFEIKQRITESDYHEKIKQILQHIQKGDIYEMNFCMEFFAENAMIDPLEKYFMLNEISRAPFSCFFKNNEQFLLSASPERYLKKENDLVISQPIKGTSARFVNVEQDDFSKTSLQNDQKERSENIMITDLVRNDLSRIATKGSVQVEELCGIYSFLQVHQMITTITANLDSQFHSIDLLRATFPMGSMTGAPKISAMQIIEQLECSKRGIYSGAIGYFSPTGDLDFNVVIRSVLFNKKKKYVSFSVGSAITSLSVPENEYQECLLKAKAMLRILSDNK